MADETRKYLKIHPDDNVMVALQDLSQGLQVSEKDKTLYLKGNIKAKHKFTINTIAENEKIIMYGVQVGKALKTLEEGSLIATENTTHSTDEISLNGKAKNWAAPDTSKWKQKTFMGYHRKDGSVGTANHWLVIPLVYCENHNIDVLKEAFAESLGYGRNQSYKENLKTMLGRYQSGANMEEISSIIFQPKNLSNSKSNRVFKNIDGIKFLTHALGCCGTKMDTVNLCGLLAGYITHPNVAGATVLSLGCQNAQIDLLLDEVKKRDANFDKPLYCLEQQKIGTEEQLINEALKKTFTGLIKANVEERKPAPLSKLCIGLECGGSDGFSGISANPAVGFASDLVVALGGTTILAEFPELCGVEKELAERCVDKSDADRFLYLMKNYNAKAEALGSGFYANPTAGNIKDGLITDAIKSAGAAKKGGTSPVTQVLDYPEKATKKGLALLCTPGGDVESTTAEAAAGANIILFTTGLGTPTGNVVAPTIKLSSSTALYKKMPDIIDINCGSIIDGKESIEELGEKILDYILEVASGIIEPKAVQLGQDDFLPWKRDISL